MAERDAEKAKRGQRQVAAKRQQSSRVGASGPSAAAKSSTSRRPAKAQSGNETDSIRALSHIEQQNRELMAERDRLKSDLEAANARLRALEEQHRQISDRISWAIDSLQSLIEEERK